jgi:hypothetical protein
MIFQPIFPAESESNLKALDAQFAFLDDADAVAKQSWCGTVSTSIVFTQQRELW